MMVFPNSQTFFTRVFEPVFGALDRISLEASSASSASSALFAVAAALHCEAPGDPPGVRGVVRSEPRGSVSIRLLE